ncbi:uncharacterized protein [Haliotis asinina]|uniref:uncharacterized protein n=1 Tax=Haliotis asinina TaxID=109174 RepID=UPI00353265C9
MAERSSDSDASLDIHERIQHLRTMTEKGKSEHLRLLRNKTIGALSNLTKCKNELESLLFDNDNLPLVKSCIHKLHDLSSRYQTCNEIYSSSLDTEEARTAAVQQAEAKLRDIKHVHDLAVSWIGKAERELFDQVRNQSVCQDSADDKQSQVSSKSQISHVSSTQSARLMEKAKLAELRTEKAMFETQSKIKQLQLDIDIAKATAREKVFADEEETIIRQQHVKFHNPDHDEIHQPLLSSDSMSQLLVLNHAPYLQAIVLKLPQHLQSKWRDLVTSLTMNGECFNGFKDLVDFIEFAAKSANEPTFGKQALTASQDLLQPKNNSSSKGKQSSSRSQSASFVTQVGHSPDGKVNSPKCFYCKQFHDLDECKHFKQKSLVEKRDFLKTCNRCFSCYGLGHSAKGCMRKKICKTCNKRHPTAMHDNSYQSSRNASHEVNSDKVNEQSNKGLNNSTSCNASKSNCIETIFQPILPVQVTVKGSNKVTTTYAMLDNGSTGCFMTEDLRNRLDVKSKPATLKLQTMNGTEYVNTSVVNGLVVSDLDGTNHVSLPGTYSKEVMPVDHAHIPKPELLKQIPHLRTVADKLPTYMPNLDIGILIGSNCPDALKPLEVVSSNDSGPFAVLHKHGWTINGPMQVRQNIVDNTVVCNRIILHEVEKSRECIAPETGPDLANSLIGVLTRFRSESVAFMGDVEAMFHQVKVPKEQQDFLRFFWWPNGNIQGELKEFRMTGHTFGTISSPTIANYALRESANKAKNSEEDSPRSL